MKYVIVYLNHIASTSILAPCVAIVVYGLYDGFLEYEQKNPLSDSTFSLKSALGSVSLGILFGGEKSYKYFLTFGKHILKTSSLLPIKK